MTPAKDQQEAKEVKRVHAPARPVERFDQVVRYMRRHGGQAQFGSEVRSLPMSKSGSGNGKAWRKAAVRAFNSARERGGNQ